MTHPEPAAAQTFRVIEQRIRIRCDAVHVARVVDAQYGAWATVETGDGRADLGYEIHGGHGGAGFRLRTPMQGHVEAPDLADLLFVLDKDLTISLQRRRPDLLFLHAAALERAGMAMLLVGDSGHGKSTTAWGLLHHGYRYLSDELAPIDMASLEVHPYARALCLKAAPPAAYPLPTCGVVDLGDTLHLPASTLPAATVQEPVPIAAIVIVRHRDDLEAPDLQRTDKGEAAARLYGNALNALAHPGRGLDAVLRVVERIPCFRLETAALRPTCELVEAFFSASGGA